MPKQILITGGLGFVGTNLVQHLHSDPVKIRIVDNESTGAVSDLRKIVSVDKIDPHHLDWDSPIHWVKGDIRDDSLVQEVVKGTEAIVHLAAETGVIPSIENPKQDCDVNVWGTFNFLRAAVKSHVKKFIFASSGAPLGEQNPPIHETLCPRPKSPYGASKLAGEAYCQAFHGAYGLQTLIFRFSNVFGPYSYHKGSVVAKFFKQILEGKPLVIYGDGNQTRDFIFVRDLCCAIEQGLIKNNIGGEIFQIATGRETRILSLVDKINSVVGTLKAAKHFHEPARQGEIRRNFSDISKASYQLDFKPVTELEEGLRQTWEWFFSASFPFMPK